MDLTLDPPCASSLVEALRAPFAGASHGVIVASENGIIQLVNVAAAAIFNFRPSDLIGEPLSRLLPGAAPPAHEDQRAEFWKNSSHSNTTIADGIITGIRRDGARVPVEVRFSMLADGTTRHVIVSIVDITERRDLETRLAAATNARQSFHQLIADMAARFGAVNISGIVDAIEVALGEIGEALQLDCAMLWRWRSDGAQLPALQHWVRPPYSLPEPPPMASIPYAAANLTAGDVCSFATVDDLPDLDREAFRLQGFRSGALLPLVATGDEECVLSALALGSVTREQQWESSTIERLRLVAAVMSQALARRATQSALQQALDEIRQLQNREAT